MQNKIYKTSIVVSLALASGMLAAASWNYDQHGNDWTGTCATGQSQSPINIDTNFLTDGDYFAKFDRKAKTATATNNGHSVVFSPENRNVVVVDNVSQQEEVFYLLQFHLHNGSEHTVDNNRYDLEAHFVHANQAFIDGEENGRLAVFGVFLEGTDSSSNKHWNKVLSDLPGYTHDHEESVTKKITPNYANLMPASKKVFTYEGSLTTPACNEIVNWVVFEEPVKVSNRSVANFAASQDNHATYRNTQPVNARTIKMGDLQKKSIQSSQ